MKATIANFGPDGIDWAKKPMTEYGTDRPEDQSFEPAKDPLNIVDPDPDGPMPEELEDDPVDEEYRSAIDFDALNALLGDSTMGIINMIKIMKACSIPEKDIQRAVGLRYGITLSK